ncbi:hypothetical protein SDJN02_07207, partial [Cucurbita argyrosperma subsp. argyrosperma]
MEPNSVSHLDEEVDRVWKVKLLCETKFLERKTANNQWSFQKINLALWASIHARDNLLFFCFFSRGYAK